ncbi:hypothetical protein [Stomatohabitans albus]|uniref:hypothetical protein n=1 Tax=Stomatohabitans albus TaxID=3110766 RepID=UPI00300C15B3
MQSESARRRISPSQIGMGLLGFFFVPFLFLCYLLTPYIIQTILFFTAQPTATHDPAIAMQLANNPDTPIEESVQEVELFSYQQEENLETYAGRSFNIDRSKWLYEGEILTTEMLMNEIELTINKSHSFADKKLVLTCFNRYSLNGVQAEIARDSYDDPSTVGKPKPIPEPQRSILMSTIEKPSLPEDTDYAACAALIDQINELYIKKDH